MLALLYIKDVFLNVLIYYEPGAAVFLLGTYAQTLSLAESVLHGAFVLSHIFARQRAHLSLLCGDIVF